MSDDTPRTNPALPPHVQLVQMGMGVFVSRILYAAARLGIADELADGPKSAEETTLALTTHTPSLYRLMRTLAGLGILRQCEDQRFALTPMGEALRTGAPGSARATLLSLCGDWILEAWMHIIDSIETGETGMEKAHGVPLFEFLAQRPAEASQFSETMVGIHGEEPPAVAAAYDFSAFGTVIDVGGATGNLLATILAHHPSPRGVLFDRPHVVEDAPSLLRAHGVEKRISIASGSFFDSVPEGGDVYLMSHIIHDWSEAQCLTILANCRRSMGAGSRLLIVEMVLPEDDSPHPGKILDMMMLVVPGGQERTAAEYGALLEKAGFRMNRVIPTASAVSIVEAFPN